MGRVPAGFKGSHPFLAELHRSPKSFLQDKSTKDEIQSAFCAVNS